MAYLADFENDLFISYARLNNQSDTDDGEGWVSRFHARLESELKQLAGRELKIWRDLQDLERNQLFDVTIKRAVEQSGLLVVINSLSWKASTYCQEEARWFGERAQQDGWGLAIGDRKRVFNVRFNNIPYTEWHPVLSGANPYNFFEAEAEDDVALPLSPKANSSNANCVCWCAIFSTRCARSNSPKRIASNRPRLLPAANPPQFRRM